LDELAAEMGVTHAVLRRKAVRPLTMDLHSSTYQLNLSRSCRCNLLKPPNVSLKECSHQAEKWTIVSPSSVPSESLLIVYL